MEKSLSLAQKLCRFDIFWEIYAEKAQLQNDANHFAEGLTMLKMLKKMPIKGHFFISNIIAANLFAGLLLTAIHSLNTAPPCHILFALQPKHDLNIVPKPCLNNQYFA